MVADAPDHLAALRQRPGWDNSPATKCGACSISADGTTTGKMGPTCADDLSWRRDPFFQSRRPEKAGPRRMDRTQFDARLGVSGARVEPGTRSLSGGARDRGVAADQQLDRRDGHRHGSSSGHWMSDADQVTAGREAWAQIHSATDFESWKAAALAVAIGKSYALLREPSTSPSGGEAENICSG